MKKSLLCMLFVLSAFSYSYAGEDVQKRQQCGHTVDDFGMLLNYAHLCNPEYSTAKYVFDQTVIYMSNDFHTLGCKAVISGEITAAAVKKYAVDKMKNPNEVKKFCESQSDRAFKLLTKYHPDYKTISQ